MYSRKRGTYGLSFVWPGDPVCRGMLHESSASVAKVASALKFALADVFELPPCIVWSVRSKYPNKPEKPYTQNVALPSAWVRYE